MSHKPVTINIAGAEQEGAKLSRKSLKTLQHTATDKENLTGRPPRSLKDLVSKDRNWELLESKRKKLSKETQAGADDKISEDDLTSAAGPSENYWELLAGKRQVALQDALEENEKLWKLIEELKEENGLIKQMLEEANSFVEVFKEMVEDNNDTGIDVRDVSTADVSAADVSAADVSAADVSAADVSAAVASERDSDDSSAGPSEKRAKEE